VDELDKIRINMNNITHLLNSIEIIPNRFLNGKKVLMCNQHNIPLGYVDIEKGPFHKDMKKLHMSYELSEELKNYFEQT
jgi:hypothetical protein